MGNKTFFLRDGFWMDSGVETGEPTVDYPYGSDSYFSLIASKPGIGRYLSVGKNVVVQYDGVTYRIGEGVVGVEEETGSLPTPGTFDLSPNMPNPFNANTLIRFQVPASTGTEDMRDRFPRAELTVYDLAGRRVRTLVEGPIEPGIHAIPWDGKDEENQGVSTGVYIVRLQVEGKGSQARKIMLLR